MPYQLVLFNQQYSIWILLTIGLLCFVGLIMVLVRICNVLEQLRDYWREHLAFMEGRNSSKQP